MFNTWSCWKGCGRYAGKRNILCSLDVQKILVQFLLFELLQLSQQIVLKHHMKRQKCLLYKELLSSLRLVLVSRLKGLAFDWLILGFYNWVTMCRGLFSNTSVTLYFKAVDQDVEFKQKYWNNNLLKRHLTIYLEENVFMFLLCCIFSWSHIWNVWIWIYFFWPLILTEVPESLIAVYSGSPSEIMRNLYVQLKLFIWPS